MCERCTLGRGSGRVDCHLLFLAKRTECQCSASVMSLLLTSIKLFMKMKVQPNSSQGRRANSRSDSLLPLILGPLLHQGGPNHDGAPSAGCPYHGVHRQSPMPVGPLEPCKAGPAPAMMVITMTAGLAGGQQCSAEDPSCQHRGAGQTHWQF